jgi:hypothetical protein
MHQAVFYGIMMNIIDMRPTIIIVPNQMFPKAALPDAALALCIA